jgi:cytochrome b subunit of formate dehydrogenase
MAATKPYQPLSLRILHSITVLLVVSCLISGFLVYNNFDGRYGQIRDLKVDGIIDLHGTIGLTFLIFFPLFGLYSLMAGKKRLFSLKSLSTLKQLNQPVWWFNIHRIANTLMLVASMTAIASGKMMEERWLPSQELDQMWYLLHLASWVLMILAIAFHLLMGVKIGGLPLLMSMVDTHINNNDFLVQLLKKR